MRHTSRFLLIVLPLLFVVASISAGTSSPTDPSAEAGRAREKAAYTFMEAANAFADGRYDDYYMLLRHARSLDPEDPFIAGEIAEFDMISPLTDSVAGERAYQALRRRFLAAPTDLRLAGVYANAATEAQRIDDLLEVWSILDSLRPDRSDVSLNLAGILVVKSLRGDSTAFPRAIAIYDRLLAGLPGDIGVTSHKIRAYSAVRDTASIISELRKLAATAPDNLDINLYEAGTYAAFAMPDSAMKYFDHALALEPESGRVFMARAQYFRDINDQEAFDREVFNALAASDLDFDPKFELLVQYVQGLFSDRANRPRIDAMFERLLELNPGEARLHALYGAYEESQDRRPEAIEQYAYSLDLDGAQNEIWMAYLRLLSMENRADELMEASERAAKLFPEEFAFPMTVASMLIYKDRKEDALAYLDSINPAAISDPGHASSYHSTRGDLFEALGRRDSAYAEYTRAVELNPRNAMAMNNMAYFMALDSINLPLARTYASMAVSEDPENPTYLDTYAWVEFRRRNFVEAKELIDRALAAYNDSLESEVDSVFEAADSLLRTSEAEATADGSDYPEVIDVAVDYPESADVYDHAGDIYFWNGLHREAVEFWEKAAMLAPDDEKIRKKVKHKTYFFE